MSSPAMGYSPKKGLLAALPRRDYAELSAQLDPLSLSVRTTLVSERQPIRYVYFSVHGRRVERGRGAGRHPDPGETLAPGDRGSRSRRGTRTPGGFTFQRTRAPTELASVVLGPACG